MIMLSDNSLNCLFFCGAAASEIRNENKKLQRPFKEDVEKVIGELLFAGNIEEAKETIYKMWTNRKETKRSE